MHQHAAVLRLRPDESEREENKWREIQSCIRKGRSRPFYRSGTRL